MACFRRKRKNWSVVTCLAALVMFIFNIFFLMDLTINHDAHNQLIDAIKNTGRKGEEGGAGGGEESLTRFFSVDVISSKEEVKIKVSGKEVYKSVDSSQRGIHLAVLSQEDGALMAARVFDTYLPGTEDDLVTFLNGITDGRVLCFAIQDEGTFSLTENGRDGLSAAGSRLSSTLSWRDMWALVTIKGAKVLSEDIGKSMQTQEWGPPVHLTVTIVIPDTVVECDWPKTPENEKRLKFCSKYEGYGSLCHCAKPLPLSFHPPPLNYNRLLDIPIAVIASNRPLYLFRMLRQLLSTPGARPSMVTVFIDGYFEEPKDVTELFNIRAVEHEPKSKKNGRISQHYKSSLSGTFHLYPSADYMIIIEEDLEISPDFFSYFSQTLPLLEQDDSLYCVSAWNDQGYDHSCEDPGLLYRVETMPGLGWLLKKKLYKDELEPNWPSPDKLWDWDMWMRLEAIRKGRECVIPDISRTFHFGASGLNMNPYFHNRYFKDHTLNKIPNVTLKDINSLVKSNYELLVHRLFREASVLDHNKDPCGKNFIPNTKGKVYVIYITMTTAKDYGHWLKLAKCFKLWDLDARGFHKGLWRFWLHGNHILVVGHPYSPYSAKYKPSGISPYILETPKSS